MTKMEKIPGYIEWLKSKNTNKEFPIFVPSADVDYVTDGISSATSLSDEFIAVGQVTSEEYSLEHKGDLLFEKRMNKTFSRNDLRVITINRIIDNSPDSKDLNFQDFLKQYQPSTVLYNDPYDKNGVAEVIRNQSVEEFINEGGHIELVKI